MNKVTLEFRKNGTMLKGECTYLELVEGMNTIHDAIIKSNALNDTSLREAYKDIFLHMIDESLATLMSL